MARPTAHDLTANGNAKVTTAQFKFGTASYLGDHTGGNFVSTPDDTDFAFAGNDWTMEWWQRWGVAASNGVLWQQWGAAGNKAFYIQYQHNNKIFELNYTTDGTTVLTIDTTGGATLNLNQWYHCAMVRNGANLLMFVDGTQWGATGNIGTDSIYNSTASFALGGITGVAECHDGWADEFRLSKIARYTANFTAPTAAFTNDSNTLLLVHCDGADLSTTFTDDAGAASLAARRMLTGIGS